MDGARVIRALAAAVALVGCRDAGARTDPGGGVREAAEPRHGVEVPAEWKALDGVAEKAIAAAREVLGEDADAHAHAWGETSRGCFLAIVEAHGGRKDAIVDVVSQLQASLGQEDAEWTTSPDAESESELQATWPHGRLHAHVVLDGRKIPHVVAATCFYNDRQPAVCEAACTPMLATLAPLEVEP